MRRPPALYGTSWFHIVNRGVAGSAIVRDDADRQRLLDTLGRALDGTEVRVHAYCVMTTHYHLLIEGSITGVAPVMKRFAQSYAQSFNTRYERYGPLFAGRFHPVAIDNDVQLATVVRYIALNPTAIDRHDIEHFPWSSHGVADTEQQPDWLESGIADRVGGPDRYRELIDGGRPSADIVIETARLVLDEMSGGRRSRRGDVRDVALLVAEVAPDALAHQIIDAFDFDTQLAARKARHRARARCDEPDIANAVERVRVLTRISRVPTDS